MGTSKNVCRLVGFYYCVSLRLGTPTLNTLHTLILSKLTACIYCIYVYAGYVFSENNLQEDLFDQILLGRLEFPTPYWENISASAKVCINT